MTPIENKVTNIVDGVKRARALLFVMTFLCAVMGANTFLERYSFDDRVMLNAGLFKRELAKAIDATHDDTEKARLASRITRLDNSLRDFKFRTVSIWPTGINVPANDLNVIGGFFLVVLGVWMLFSINQIHDALDEPAFRAGGKGHEYLEALVHTAKFALPIEAKPVLKVLAYTAFALPFLTMSAALGNDIYSIVTYDH